MLSFMWTNTNRSWAAGQKGVGICFARRGTILIGFYNLLFRKHKLQNCLKAKYDDKCCSPRVSLSGLRGAYFACILYFKSSIAPSPVSPYLSDCTGFLFP